MSNKNLVFVINAHQGYIRNIYDDKDFSVENNILFSAISQTYIPLLNMLNRLEKENLNFKFGLVLSSPLCSLLSDEIIQNQYINYLDRTISLGILEVEKLKGTDLEKNARLCLERQISLKQLFVENYEKNLVAQFQEYAKKGYIELIATCATYAFLPHYSNLTEALNAQVETGLYSQKHYFGDTGEGFYLPYLGWSKNVDTVLRSYGVDYTIVDYRSLLFSETSPENGIFTPVRCNNSLVLFANDPELEEEINGDEGYLHNEVYRNQSLDIGYEIEGNELTAFLGNGKRRCESMFKYWSNTEETEDERVIYNLENAYNQTKDDAFTFYNKRLEKLLRAEEILGEKEENVSIVCALDAEYLGQKWAEGVDWFENIIRLCVLDGKVNLVSCNDLLGNQYNLPKTQVYPCADNGLGYGEDLMQSENSWMVRYVQKATERIIDLTDRLPNESSLKGRLLNLGATQVLLSQSGEWPKMICDSQSDMKNFATDSFKKEILSFSKVFEALASNSVSTEWLTTLEKEDALFPWMNYRVFSRKK